MEKQPQSWMTSMQRPCRCQPRTAEIDQTRARCTRVLRLPSDGLRWRVYRPDHRTRACRAGDDRRNPGSVGRRISASQAETGAGAGRNGHPARGGCGPAAQRAHPSRVAGLGMISKSASPIVLAQIVPTAALLASRPSVVRPYASRMSRRVAEYGAAHKKQRTRCRPSPLFETYRLCYRGRPTGSGR